MKKISFIGVGIMGKSMVRNLMKAGFELHIYARTKAKVEDVISEGAIFHESIRECVSECDAVITIVGFPQDVEEVYFDEGNILDQAEKKEIRFEFELPEKMHVKHDANWLGEALFNLLYNAVKNSPQNGKIKISLQENEMFTTFSIRDYGIGIEPEEKNLIFQRFYRGKRVTDEEGFGIGLYLAREILFLHEGLLTVKRCEPGVEMKLSLPRQ